MNRYKLHLPSKKRFYPERGQVWAAKPDLVNKIQLFSRVDLKIPNKNAYWQVVDYPEHDQLEIHNVDEYILKTQYEFVLE